MSEAAPLTVVHVDAEMGFSGGEVQVFLLMEGLRTRGHRCVLVAARASRATAEAESRGFETRHVHMRGDLDLASVVELSGMLRALRPDIVHLHTGRATWLGGLAAKAAKCPAITTRRMDRRVKRGWRTRLVYGRLTRKVAAISPAIARSLLEGGVDPSKIEIVPSTIDPARIVTRRGRAATRADLGVTERTVMFLTLAALVPRKGIPDLVEACARLGARGVDFVCCIAGDGPEREALENFARRGTQPERVRFLGRREDVGDLLAACDVFVLPSHAEGLGVSALEAMAAGRAVVATRVGGLADAVVEGLTGLLVSPLDPPELAEAMERVANDDALRSRLGAAGPARIAEKFLPEAMVASYERIYREVITASAKRA